MAKLFTARHWESNESFNYLGKNFTNKFAKPQENPNNDKAIMMPDDTPKESPLKQVPKQKAMNVAANSTKSKPLTKQRLNEIFLEPSHVKASALLYEITERTNQLAQPRIRTDQRLVPGRLNILNIPRASPRIIELSKPRAPFWRPTKQHGYVTPAALTAVATQRIIELSKPKKKRRLKVPNKRKPRLHKEKSRSHVKRVKKRSEKQKKGRRKQRPLKISNSQRTIIMIGRNLKDSKKNRRHL